MSKPKLTPEEVNWIVKQANKHSDFQGVYSWEWLHECETKANTKPFLFVNIGNGYELKYDGYRKAYNWTLLRENGGRIFDGTFIDILDYLNEDKKYV